MGTWGVGLLSDDTAVDVYGEYIDKYNDGVDHAVIRKVLEKEFAEYLDDDGPVFWIALSLAQWECGVLTPDVQERVVGPGKFRKNAGTTSSSGCGTGKGRKREVRLRHDCNTTLKMALEGRRGKDFPVAAITQ